MIESFMLKDGHRVRIEYDEEPQNPREFHDFGKLCIKKHRDYDFPNELNFDFDGEDQLLHTYYQFSVFLYIHSGISFSLSTKPISESERAVPFADGFIAIPKTRGCTETKLTEQEALKFAEEELKIRNQYVNGECYGYIEEELILRKSERGEKEERETVDACGGFRSIEEIEECFKDRM